MVDNMPRDEVSSHIQAYLSGISEHLSKRWPDFGNYVENRTVFLCDGSSAKPMVFTCTVYEDSVVMGAAKAVKTIYYEDPKMLDNIDRFVEENSREYNR